MAGTLPNLEKIELQCYRHDTIKWLYKYWPRKQGLCALAVSFWLFIPSQSVNTLLSARFREVLMESMQNFSADAEEIFDEVWRMSCVMMKKTLGFCTACGDAGQSQSIKEENSIVLESF